jgi:G3E family GTPase
VQDVVILNKIDLVKDGLEDLESHIHDVNALITVVKSVRCQVDLNEVFDRQAYGAKVSKESELQFSFPSPLRIQREGKLTW